MRNEMTKHEGARRGAQAAPLMLLLLCASPALLPAQRSARSAFEQLAPQLDCLEPSDFELGRAPAELAPLARHPRRELEPLLGHPDPRVRALALCMLAQQADPRALPAMVALAFDPAPAPSGRQLHAVALARPGQAKGPPWSPRPQTVGQLATAFVTTYLEAAGSYGGVEGTEHQPGFAEYWAARRNRTHCLSWFALDLQRASQRSFPLPEDAGPAIAALRARIDALAPDYRAWVLLALAAPWETGGSEPGAEALAPEADLVAAAQALGGDEILRLLRGQARFPADPDFRYGDHSPFAHRRVVPFLLQHARELLGPEHAAELRALGRRHLAREPVGRSPALVTARWFTAAAELDPEHAGEILRDALARFAGPQDTDAQDHRARLALALWVQRGPMELPRVLDWFFAEEPQRGAFGFGRTRFAAELGGAERRELLRAILADARLPSLDWQTLRGLAEAANQHATEPVIPAAVLRDLGHPFGMGHYHWQRDAAREQHPAATAALEAELARWRAALAAWAQGRRD